MRPSVLLTLQATLVASAQEREALASPAAAGYRENSRHIDSASETAVRNASLEDTPRIGAIDQQPYGVS